MPTFSAAALAAALMKPRMSNSLIWSELEQLRPDKQACRHSASPIYYWL
jgi:hypothetical protein